MLISVSELHKNWGINPNGVLHVGAHLGEEAEDYQKFKWLPAIWIEAQPTLVEQLQLKLKPPMHRIIAAAIWNINDVRLKLHVASNSMSSSLLDFGSHSNSYPEITFVEEIEVITKRLDKLIELEDMPNFLCIDIQGAELPAIQSLGELILKLDYIFVEVNRREVYKECTKVKELDFYLDSKDFKRVTTRWFFKQGWGDALYIRKNKITRRKTFQIIQTWCNDSVFYAKQLPLLVKIYKLFYRVRLVKQR